MYIYIYIYIYFGCSEPIFQFSIQFFFFLLHYWLTVLKYKITHCDITMCDSGH